MVFSSAQVQLVGNSDIGGSATNIEVAGDEKNVARAIKAGSYVQDSFTQSGTDITCSSSLGGVLASPKVV
jgi:microcompartment protein CcmL/EutN